MLDTAARYLYEVYRCKSVSLAAQKLFISQPALSATIRKAEQELGAPIFNRKTLPFTLTEEGRIYMDTVEKMLTLENNAAQQIRDIQEVKGGTLRVATSTILSYRAIPKILQLFHKRYPHVDVHIIITESNKLYELLDKALADLIFIPVDAEPECCCVTRLLSQRMVVILRKDALVNEKLRQHAITREQLLSGDYPPEKMVMDNSAFHDVEFIHISQDSYISKNRIQLLGRQSNAPYITANTSRVQINYQLMLAGFGALITTDANVALLPPSGDCVFFALGSPLATSDFSVVYSKKNPPRNMAALQAFVDTAAELFDCQEPLKLLL